MKGRRAAGRSGALRDRQEDVAPDESGESGRVVQQIERREMVATADIVLPAFARPEQDPGVIAGRRLADLHIKTVTVQGRLPADSDPAVIPAQVEFVRRQAERRGEIEEPSPR